MGVYCLMHAGKLVECTSTEVCPYATPQYSIALNKTVLVNNAPTSLYSGMIMVSLHGAAWQPYSQQACNTCVETETDLPLSKELSHTDAVL